MQVVLRTPISPPQMSCAPNLPGCEGPRRITRGYFNKTHTDKTTHYVYYYDYYF